MSQLRRRTILSYAACLSGMGLLGCKGPRSESQPALPTFAHAPKGPRYVVQILLSGGHDAVYTTDPKHRSEVESDIDLPAENKIIEVGGLRLGPHFAPLEEYAKHLAILNSVQVGTANHETGIKQFTRLKTRATDVMPSALDIIGTARDSQALGTVHVGPFMRTAHSPKFFGTSDPFYYGDDDIFAVAEKNGEHAYAIAERLRDQARTLGANLSPAQQVTVDNLQQTAAFFDRVPDLPTFEKREVLTDYTAQSISESMDRTLWLLQNDLARCVYVDLGLLGWDTHILNQPRQEALNRAFTKSLTRLLAGLIASPSGNGSLLDDTLLIAGSDLGRFPKLNGMMGKDHLPQTSYIFAGHGIAGGKAHGPTDTVMKGMKMSLATGRADDRGHVPIVDDIGTTVMRVCGLDPQKFGYAGKTIECLLG